VASAGSDILAGEASAIRGEVGKRQRGSAFVFYAILVGLYVLGAALGYGAGLLLRASGVAPEADLKLAALIGFLVGGLVYLAFVRKWTIQRFRQKMEEHGLKTTFPLKVELTEAGVDRWVGRVHSIAEWGAVTELFRVKGYWIFLVQMDPWVVPSRAFADQAAEKAFIKEALSHMTPDALERSLDAETFASS
jgi:hypothetical protein